MGEVVLRDVLAQDGVAGVEVSSAGVSTEETGNPIDRRAARVLAERGHELPARHYAHRATDEELRQADLILAMTTGHARSLRAMLNALGEPVAKLHLWREFDGTTDVAPDGAFGRGGVLVEDRAKDSRSANLYHSAGEFDVPDPWYGSQEDFYETYDVVERGAHGISAFIADGQN